MFKIYAMVSEIHDNVDLVLRVKDFVELEGEISMRELTFKFLNNLCKNDQTQRNKIARS